MQVRFRARLSYVCDEISNLSFVTFFQVFTNALTSLPGHARQSLTDLRFPQREDLVKKISGLHATFSCSSSTAELDPQDNNAKSSNG